MRGGVCKGRRDVTGSYGCREKDTFAGQGHASLRKSFATEDLYLGLTFLSNCFFIHNLSNSGGGLVGIRLPFN